MDLAFDLVQMVYWLMLAGWFGLVLFAAMATPVIFRTVHEADPTLPTVLSVNLEGQHGVLLSMTIIANVLTRLVWVQLVCAGAVLAAIVGQWAFIDHSGSALILGVLRSALFIAATGLVIYNWRVIWPRAASLRNEYLENADNLEAAETVRNQLARTERESEFVQLVIATILSAMILFSVGIRKGGAPRERTLQSPIAIISR